MIFQYIPQITLIFCIFNFMYLFFIMYQCGQLTDRIDALEKSRDGFVRKVLLEEAPKVKSQGKICAPAKKKKN